MGRGSSAVGGQQDQWGSLPSHEASLRAWRSLTVLKQAEIVLRIHVGFAVLAAQKAYFDLQMAAFYM